MPMLFNMSNGGKFKDILTDSWYNLYKMQDSLDPFPVNNFHPRIQ